jgi:23S rRNA pseudouridine1911/1915/1917 synthase
VVAAAGYEFCLIVLPGLFKMLGYLEVMNDSNQSLSVDAGGQRLDVYLAGAVPEVSRSHWKGLIQDAWVTVNGSTCKPNHTLKAGDKVCWSIPGEAATEPQPEDIPLDILFEDETVLVLNKPPGLVVHPAVGNESGTLLNALLFHDPVFHALDRAGIVHRLDKDTSGVMVVTKSDASMAELQRQFKARETKKEYLALVWGHPPPSGRIETLIGRHPVHRKKMAVLEEGGREAVSNFQTLEQFSDVALVEVEIETGRTHQIRVHLSHLGHPVVGDTVYGRARKNRLPLAPERQMLHAAKLEFTHPSTGKRISFNAPLFDDMFQLLELLRKS